MGKLKNHCHCDDCGLIHWPDTSCEQAQKQADQYEDRSAKGQYEFQLREAGLANIETFGR